jgi:hypothetical protein
MVVTHDRRITKLLAQIEIHKIDTLTRAHEWKILPMLSAGIEVQVEVVASKTSVASA